MLNEQLGKLLQQAQKLQADVGRVQEDLKNTRIETDVDDGSIKIIVNGRQQIIDIILDKGLIHPANAKIIQDLLVKGVNKALEQSKNRAYQEINKVTGGVDLSHIPGLF